MGRNMNKEMFMHGNASKNSGIIAVPKIIGTRPATPSAAAACLGARRRTIVSVSIKEAA